MADEKLQYSFVLRTTAEGTGAKTTATELKNVAEAQTAVNRAQAEGSASRRDVNQFLSETTDKARYNSVAFYDLDKQQTKTANGVTAMGKGMKMSGQDMMQLAYAADDLQYGLKGITNNVPMIALALGAPMQWAAGFSIAAVGVNMLSNALSKGGDSAKDFKMDMDAVVAGAKGLILDQMDDDLAALEARQAAFRLTLQPNAPQKSADTNSRKQETEEALALVKLDSQLKDLTGVRSTIAAELAEKEKTADIERRARLQEAIIAQNELVEGKRTELELAQLSVQEQREKVSAKEDEIEKLRVEVEILRSRKETMVKQAAHQYNEWAIESEEIQRLQDAEDARRNLPLVTADEKGKSGALEEAQGQARDLAKALKDLTQNVDAADQALTDQQVASQQNIDTELRRAGVDATLDKADVVNSAQSEMIDRLNKIVDFAKDQGGNAKIEVDKIREQISDNQLTMEELGKLPGELQRLFTAFKGSSKDFAELMKIAGDTQQAATIQASRILELKRDNEALKRQMQELGKPNGSN